MKQFSLQNCFIWNDFRSKIVSYETIFAPKFGISKIVLGPKQFLPPKVYVQRHNMQGARGSTE